MLTIETTAMVRKNQRGLRGDPTLKNFGGLVPEVLVKKVRTYANLLSMTNAQILEEALEKWLEDNKDKVSEFIERTKMDL